MTQCLNIGNSLLRKNILILIHNVRLIIMNASLFFRLIFMSFNVSNFISFSVCMTDFSRCRTSSNDFAPFIKTQHPYSSLCSIFVYHIFLGIEVKQEVVILYCMQYVTWCRTIYYFSTRLI